MDLADKKTTIQIKTIEEKDLLPLWQISHGPTADFQWHQWNGPYFKDPRLNWAAFQKLRGPKICQQPLHGGIWYQERLIGEVNAYFEDGNLARWLEFGIVIYDCNLWHAGIGTAAGRLWLHYLFDQYPDLPHIGFTTWSGNERMMKLGEKLGMQKEAQIRQVRYWQGQYYDSVKYGVLRGS